MLSDEPVGGQEDALLGPIEQEDEIIGEDRPAVSGQRTVLMCRGIGDGFSL